MLCDMLHVQTTPLGYNIVHFYYTLYNIGFTFHIMFRLIVVELEYNVYNLYVDSWYNTLQSIQAM